MYIFGGILELTKELNEMLIYDFKSGCFSTIGSDNALDDLQGNSSNVRGVEGAESPTLRKQTTLAAQSPTKVGTFSKSPTKTMKATAKKGNITKSPKKKVDVAGEEDKEKKESGLASPTSISMQNSFIIKNADESFEAYFQQMRRRKLGNAGNDLTNGGLSATLPSNSPGV
jgi:hypothetical protein